MSRPFTTEGIKQSKCWHLNKHLEEEKPMQEKKQRLPRKDSKHVQYIKSQLTYWCIEKGYKLLTEHRFFEYRKWKFDFCIKEVMVAIEFEGGIWLEGGGAHSRPANIERDIAKYNKAQELGWKVIRLHAKTYKTVITELEENIQ